MQRPIPALIAVLATFSLGWMPPALAQDPAILRQVYQQTLESYEAELQSARQQDAQWRWQEADILNRAGIAYRYFGQYTQALAVQQQALAIAREIGDRGREANLIKELAATHSKLGDLQGIQFLEQQLEQQGSDRGSRVAILQQLGLAYLSIGDRQRTLEIYEDYIPLATELQKHQEVAIARSSLAGIYLSLKDYDQAIELYQQTLATAKDQGDTTTSGNTLLALASAYKLAGNVPQAIATYQQAAQRAQGLGKVQEQLIVQQQLAFLLQSKQQADQAIKLLQQNLTLAETNKDQFWQAWSLGDLSVAYLQLGENAQAIKAQEQGLSITRQMQRSSNQPPGISSAQSLTNLGFILLRSGKPSEAATILRQAIESYTDQQQQVLGNANLFAMRRDDLNIRLRESLSDTYQILQQVLNVQNRTEQGLELAEESRARATVDLLNQRLDLQPSQVAASLTLDQMRQIARQQNTVLVQYAFLYNQPVSYSVKSAQNRRETQLLIWVIQPTGDLAFRSVPLDGLSSATKGQSGVGSPIEALVRDSRRAMGVGGRGVDTIAKATFQQSETQSLKQLYNLLIEPIETLLPPDPEVHVTFIPQGPLFLVPFAALKYPSGQYLIERHTIRTAPSIQVLDLLEGRNQQLQTGPSVNALVVGNPAMPSVRPQIGAPSEQLPNLPGAEQEAKAIATLLGTQPLLGAAATETTVVEQLPQADIIHLATHGLLDDVLGLRSAVAFTQTDTADGLLTSYEIINLNLKAEMAVLSACDTGKGRISGDAVIGLSRAFIGAGVPSLVVSLWAIPDLSTTVLMTRFYQNLQHTSDKAQALRQAMLSTKQQYPNPRDWAAFTLVGSAQ